MELGLALIYMLVMGAVSVSMAVLLLKGAKEKYNRIFLVCQGAVELWCGSQVLLLLSDTVEKLRVSYLIGNLGICFIGVFWYYFSFSYAKKKLSWFLKYLPMMIPVLNFTMFLTNEGHHLYYKVFSLEEVTHGIFFYINVGVNYLLVVIGSVVLYKSLKERASKNLIIASVLMPLLMNAVYLLGFVEAEFDITALGFGLSVIFVLLATLRYRFMEVNVTAFDVVLSGLRDGVAIFNEKGNCTYYNHAFFGLLGIEKMKIHDTIRLQDVSGRFLQLTCQGNAEDEKEVLYIDENNRYLQLQTYEDLGKKGTVTYVIKDMSKYYELLNQTRELSVINERLALEQERNRIAQQVHDTAGHTLTMIQSYMKLTEVSSKKHEMDKVNEYLAEARILTSEGIKELRESINQLRKEAEYELVTQGIMQLADRVKEIKTEVTVQGEDSEKYSHLSGIIYESVRETITNTLKYANASKLEIIVRFQENGIEVIIGDDGDGCDEIRDNNGLHGIKERIEQAGGTVRFISSKNEGFLTRMKLPV